MILETQSLWEAIGEARAAREAGRLGERDALAQGTLALPGTTGSLFAPVQRRTA